MAFNVGINVVEVEGNASPAIVAAPTSTAGFLIRSERGVPNQALAVRGLVDYFANFGRPTLEAYGPHAVRGFFENGGSLAYVTRLVGASAVAAEQTLVDRGGTATLTVRAGQLGQADPGQWGSALEVSVIDHPRGTSGIPAQIIGSAAEPFALADGQAVGFLVDGSSTPVSVTFASGDFENIGAATAAEVLVVLRRQAPTLRAAVTPGLALVIASGTSGPRSHVAVAASAAATALGFTGATANSDGALSAGAGLVLADSVGGFVVGSALRVQTRAHLVAGSAIAASVTDGASILVSVNGAPAVEVTFVDEDFVGGAAAITPTEVVAVINRQALGFIAVLDHLGRLVLLTTEYGAGTTLGIAPGATDATAALGLTGSVPVAGVEQRRLAETLLDASRLVGWSSGLGSAVPVLAARIRSAEFDLVVGRAGVELERFEALTMQESLPYYAVSVVNDPASGSRFVMLEDEGSASGPAEDVPAVVSRSLMTAPGADGDAPSDIATIGDPVAHTGLYSFDRVAIQLLTCPETSSPAVVSAALAYCESRGDAMFVGSPPFGSDLAAAQAYAAPFRARKVYGALYAPWIRILNPLDPTGQNPVIWVPPNGHVLGTYARMAQARGVWQAPAGDSARLVNALGVEYSMTDSDHTDLVKNGGVNGVRVAPGAGIVIDASRTLSSDPRWLFVNVRRLFNFVKSSLKESLRVIAQEPNTATLRRTVRFNIVQPFLLGLWRQGAFGSDPPEQVFTIVCDESNNPPAEVNLGNFRLEVYFYPVKPAETVIISIGQLESGGSADEA